MVLCDQDFSVNELEQPFACLVSVNILSRRKGFDSVFFKRVKPYNFFPTLLLKKLDKHKYGGYNFNKIVGNDIVGGIKHDK